jgi:hypothetical protein
MRYRGPEAQHRPVEAATIRRNTNTEAVVCKKGKMALLGSVCYEEIYCRKVTITRGRGKDGWCRIVLG